MVATITNDTSTGNEIPVGWRPVTDTTVMVNFYDEDAVGSCGIGSFKFQTDGNVHMSIFFVSGTSLVCGGSIGGANSDVGPEGSSITWRV
jgi:hypothetical protein